MPSKLVFFGTENFSLPFLDLLINQGCEVAAVVTKPDSPRGRSKSLVEPAVKQLAKQKSIEVLQPLSLAQLAGRLKALKPDCGFLASYGRIVPEEIINLFPSGIVNVHPSDLPKHRGPSPIEQTILDGDTATAVSLMKLVKAMDAGPVFAKAPLELTADISKTELVDLLVTAGLQLVKDNLPAILKGELQPQPQDDSQATYTKIIHKSDGQIDWNQPADKIYRQVRAYQGWPGSYCELFNVRITIHSASVVPFQGRVGEHFISKDGLLTVYCGQDALAIHTLQPAGKRIMGAADFVRGYSP